jgi:hypothetical protein
MPAPGAPRPLPPPKPDIDDCCHAGCNPCIFDLYHEALERYRADLKIWEENVAAAAPAQPARARKSAKKLGAP